MKKVIILKGLPASGKTTYVKKVIDENPGIYKRINKDDLRAMLDNSKWSKDNEKFVLSLQSEIILMALGDGKHVIIDDTNLHTRHQERIFQLVKGMGVDVLIDSTFLDVSIEECIKRDLARPNSVGSKVIKDMHEKFLAVPKKPLAQDKQLPAAIICDIDGTLAHMNGNRGPYEWDKVCRDSIDRPIADILKTYQYDGARIILLSGRDGVCQKDTEAWLKFYNVKYDELYMRLPGDSRKDSVVKEEMFNEYVAKYFNVLFVLDDRQQMVDKWRSMGLKCLQVAKGDF